MDLIGLCIGSPARTRTTDPMVNSHLLCRLSYWGIIFLQKVPALISRAQRLIKRPPFVKGGLVIFVKYYLQLTQTRSLLMGTPVFLLIYSSCSTGAKCLPHTEHDAILKTLFQMVLLSPVVSIST